MSEIDQSLSGSEGGAASRPFPGRRRKRILLVEGDPVTRLILMSKLRSEGLHVEVAVNGFLALKKIRGGGFDALFLDLLLPDFQGVEVIRAARRDPEFARRPIYVWSSLLALSPPARQAAKAGADRIFSKISDPLEGILAEIARDLLGNDPAPGSIETLPLDREEAEVLKAIPAKLKESVTWLCQHLQLLAQCHSDEERAAKCTELWSKVHAVASCAAAVGRSRMAREAAALQAFLKELCEKPKRFSDSSLRTLSSAIGALELLACALAAAEEELGEFTAVVVDEDLFSRTATCNALRNVGFKLVAFAAPAPALAHLETHSTDLVVLDVLTGNRNRVNLCEQVRELPEHQKTPVIFVASAQNLRRSALALSASGVELVVTPYTSGLGFKALGLLLRYVATIGEPKKSSQPSKSNPAELVTRPFISMELALKALSLVIKAKSGAATDAPATPSTTLAGAEPKVPPAVRSVEDLSSLISVQEASIGLALPADERPAESDVNSVEGTLSTPPCPDTGILAVNIEGEIVSASKVCAAIFGWTELKGQEIAVLLKGGFDNELGRILQQRDFPPEHEAAGEHSLKVIALRRDGTEFLTSVILSHRPNDAKSCWTVVFRVLPSSADQAHAGLMLPETGGEPKDGIQAPSGEAAAYREAFAKLQQERETLAARVYSDELELHRSRAEMKESMAERERLEQRLKELEFSKAKLEEQFATRGENQEEISCSATQLGEELAAAKTAVERAEAALEKEVARNKAFEERLRLLGKSLELEQVERTKRFQREVAGFQQVRDQLQLKLDAEQQAVAESARRAEELEARLRASAAEVEGIRTELEQQTAEQERLESEWRQKLETAEALRSKLESAWSEATERNKRFEDELTGLRQLRDELNGKLSAEQLATAESRRRIEELESRLRDNTAELERARAELAREDRTERFEERLTSLQQVREELNGELRTEQQATADSQQRRDELETRLRENNAELSRVKADADLHAQEQARLKSELQAQVNVANAAAEHAERALKEKTAQCVQFENELANFRLVRDELNHSLAAEQKAATESSLRNQELEAQLRENAAELAMIKAEAERHGEEQARLESELRAQLSDARAAAKQAQTALEEEAARNQGFEQQLQTFGQALRMEQIQSAEQFERQLASAAQERDELNSKLAAEQQAGLAATRRVEELEGRLAEALSETERVNAELQNGRAKQADAGPGLLKDLHAARAATARGEAAWVAESERNASLRAELTIQQQACDELTGKLISEQQAIAETRKQNEELKTQRHASAGELESLKAHLERLAAERGGLESDWRQQLNAAKAAAERAESEAKEKVEECDRLKADLVNLQQGREELAGKLDSEQEAITELRKQNEELENQRRASIGELESLKAEFERQAAERGGLESDWREQLNVSKAACERAESEAKEKVVECGQLKAELSSLQQMRDELAGKLDSAQKTIGEVGKQNQEFADRVRTSARDLERVEAEMQRQIEERVNLESKRREQVSASKAQAKKAETSLKERIAEIGHFQEEVANLRQERHELHHRFVVEQQVSAKSKRRIAELEKHLRQTATGFATAKMESEKRAAEREQLEGKLRTELDAAKAMTKQAEDARQEETARCTRMEQERAEISAMHDELSAQLNTERKAAAEARQRVEELETRLRENAAELGRAKAALENETAARNQDASDQGVEGAAQAANQELCRLRENEAARAAEVSEMECRIRESVAALTRVTADLERERGERRRIEQRSTSLAVQLQQLHQELQQQLGSESDTRERINDLEQQVREHEARTLRIAASLQKETADRHLAEEQLRAVGDMGAQLRNYLSLFEDSKKVFKSAQSELDARLQTCLSALSESESKLQKEAGERQRVDEALCAMKRSLQEQSERNALELAKLQSELHVEQLERKRLESDALQSRYASLDSNRLGRTMVNNFRRHIQRPVDDLAQSTRRLLEADLKDEEKKLVESVLENALMLQTSLQETGAGAPASRCSTSPQIGGSSELQDSQARSADSEWVGGDLQP